MTKFLNISTDNTLGGNAPSDVVVSSQKAIKDYVDQHSGGGADIDNSTITTNAQSKIQAVATINKNAASGATNPIYDWVGTLAEYEAQDIETTHPDWVCYITDDETLFAGYHPGLLSWEWDDHIRNDIQWLRADTFSWQDGLMYSSAYQHLVDDIDGKSLQSETIGSTTISFYLADDGHKICPDTQASNVEAIYTATGVAWYYILDTTNHKFKLPRANSEREWLIQQTPVVGSDDAPYPTSYSIASDFVGSKVVLARTGGSSFTALTYNEGQLANSTKFTMATSNKDSSVVYNGKKYLYFYVGNFTQTALENTAGVNSEVINDFSAHRVIDFQAPTSSNNYTWYRLYEDGWVEQGGVLEHYPSGGAANDKVINLPVTMADAMYTALATMHNSDGSGSLSPKNVSIFNKTTTTITIRQQVDDKSWQVSGMAASN